MSDERGRVMVVDDDPSIRAILSDFLQSEGYNVISVASGEDALHILKQGTTLYLVLLDVLMPGMSGFDLLKIIKKTEEFKEISVIMITALGHIQDKELAFIIGAHDYIVKPIETRELLARVRTHINLKHSIDLIRIQKKRLDTLLSTVPGIVYLKSREGTYLHVNRRFIDLVEKSEQEIIGKNDDDIFPAEVAEDIHLSDDLILQYGVKEIEIEEVFSRSEGSKLTYMTIKCPIYEEPDNVAGLVGVSLEITDQKVIKNSFERRDSLLTALLNAVPFEIFAIGSVAWRF